MKIGIFGESFAHHDTLKTGESWVSLLQKESGHEVTAHARLGASQYWIYKEFLEHYQKYDKIIFVTTWYLRFTTEFTEIGGAWHARHLLKNSKFNEYQNKILEGIDAYMNISLADKMLESYHVDMHNLMLDRVKTLATNILFLPAFDSNGGLFDICIKENNFWGEVARQWYLKQRAGSDKWDSRQCHMCEKNNYILYNKIRWEIEFLNCVQTFKVNLSDFVDPDDFNRYHPSHD
jgi:hypothetical protein